MVFLNGGIRGILHKCEGRLPADERIVPVVGLPDSGIFSILCGIPIRLINKGGEVLSSLVICPHLHVRAVSFVS